MPQLAGIDHLALTVRDLAVSAAFYERLFGFAPIGELEGEGLHRRLFRLPSGTNIGLTQHETPVDGDFSPFTPGLDHVGFGVADVATLREWAAHLDEQGIHHSGLVEAPYGTALSVKDPDGVALEFFVGA
ncbi:VOC family protein [Frondihabitans cladoniiphilus]|uniref:VOC family protein n=1 Tax=Frondihabitans cladoniiphilus TaxID=715785 RepID=A0ABP8W1L9_9MICO